MSTGLTARVNFRTTPSERNRLRAEAKAVGLSVSELSRRRTCKLPIPPAKTDRITINELRRIGGLLKHTLVETKGENSNEVAEALRTVTKAIKYLYSKDAT